MNIIFLFTMSKCRTLCISLQHDFAQGNTMKSSSILGATKVTTLCISLHEGSFANKNIFQDFFSWKPWQTPCMIRLDSITHYNNKSHVEHRWGFWYINSTKFNQLGCKFNIVLQTLIGNLLRSSFQSQITKLASSLPPWCNQKSRSNID
jgi:hypothetical protein